jgi:hypothetical protein
MSSAVKQVKNEEQGKTSVAQLMSKGSTGAPLSSVNSKETYKKNNEPPSTIVESSKKKT